METRILRPQFRRMMIPCWLMLAVWWVMIGGITVYAIFWWPTHKMLESTPARWFALMFGMSLFFLAIFLLGWWVERKKSWHVNDDGIAIYHRNTRRRFIPWADVLGIQTLRFGSFVATNAKPRRVSLHYLTPADAAWLDGCVRDRVKGSGVFGK